ncbi:MAG: hypothetical protein VX113_09740, partial [Pseudomonadota bacterium]|nr:hypothetical protein [Pseudomonadota bacterium]
AQQQALAAAMRLAETLSSGGAASGAHAPLKTLDELLARDRKRIAAADEKNMQYVRDMEEGAKARAKAAVGASSTAKGEAILQAAARREKASTRLKAAREEVELAGHARRAAEQEAAPLAAASQPQQPLAGRRPAAAARGPLTPRQPAAALVAASQLDESALVLRRPAARRRPAAPS